MLKHDRDKLTAAIGRGATLMDILELNKVKTQSLLDEVIETLGTHSFNWRLKDALGKENRDENLGAAIALLESIATRVESQDGLHYVMTYDGTKPYAVPDDIGDVEYCFIVQPGAYSYIKILRKISDDENVEAQTETARRQDLDMRRNKLREIGQRAFDLRKDYIRDFSAVKTYLSDIVEWASDIMLGADRWLRLNDELLRAMLDIPMDTTLDEEQSLNTLAREMYDGQPEKLLLVVAYSYYDDKDSYCGDWNCQYTRDEKLTKLYRFLEKTGYEMSDEERALVNGEHELFVDSGDDAK
jgi:ParB family chromosome partitioning protein